MPADRQSRIRGVCLVASFAVAFVGSAVAQTREPGAPQAIAAPHYGDTLFNFYQDKTFVAITGLMVSQHFGRISPHDDEAEVLRGGMLLSYGLHDEAAAVFARLIESNTAPAVRDRAWYFLAQARHRRGLHTAAEAALARIASPLPGTLEEDRQLLRAQLMMQRGDYTAAAAVLEALQSDPKAAPYAGLYARFNLGVALVKSGEVEKGHALLDAVGKTPAPNEELRSLRDRANVALGFATLAAKQPREARLALERVRLNGPQSNKALLGFGWAAAELKDPALALVPWTELAGRGAAGGADAAVLEARIAVPYAMAELRAYNSALQGYQRATDGFDREHTALSESIAAVRAGKLVQGLHSSNPAGGATALGSTLGIRALPEMPHAAHLSPLLAGHVFQEAFKNLRDLQFLDGNLKDWRDSLGTFTDMLDNRRRAFAEKLPAVQNSRTHADAAALKLRRDALAAELAEADTRGDTVAFANPREQDLLDRMGRALGTLARVGNEVDLAEAGERLRRVAGALTWQRAQELPVRRWEARKSLKAADVALTEAAEREAALARAQRDEPARHAAFAARITALSQRLDGLAPRVAALSTEQQAQLQDIAVAELQAQQERLADYAAQARLAIAQIHDSAQFARRDTAPAGGAR